MPELRKDRKFLSFWVLRTGCSRRLSAQKLWNFLILWRTTGCLTLWRLGPDLSSIEWFLCGPFRHHTYTSAWIKGRKEMFGLSGHSSGFVLNVSQNLMTWQVQTILCQSRPLLSLSLGLDFRQRMLSGALWPGVCAIRPNAAPERQELPIMLRNWPLFLISWPVLAWFGSSCVLWAGLSWTSEAVTLSVHDGPKAQRTFFLGPDSGSSGPAAAGVNAQIWP